MMMSRKFIHQAPLFRRLQAEVCRAMSSADWIAVVAESVALILNTRQGMVASCLDYGLPDFHALLQAPRQLVHYLEEQIASTLRSYEPRLKDIEVRGSWDQEVPERLCFSIQAFLEVRQERYPVHYRSVLWPGSKLKINGVVL
jgi:type VI secretion system lysozyme-like protein